MWLQTNKSVMDQIFYTKTNYCLQHRTKPSIIHGDYKFQTILQFIGKYRWMGIQQLNK